MNNGALWRVGRLFFILLPALFFPLCGGAVFASENSAAESASMPYEMEVFVSKGCPHCARATEFLAELQAQHPGLKIVIRDVQDDPAALERLKHIVAVQPGASIRVPTFFVAGQVIVGFSAEAGSGQQILQSLQRSRVSNTPALAAQAACAADANAACGATAAAREQEHFAFDFMGRSVSLSIPAAAKPGIYSRMRGIMQAGSLLFALSGVLVLALALLVQIVELLCTSGLPALYTRILTLQNLGSASYYGYLALYDLAYMLDDVIVLSIGVYTLSQRRLQEKEGRWLKLISGVVMVGLGVYLLLYSH